MKDGLIIDLFAGGGGASVGIEMALGRKVDIAIDHDPQAIRMLIYDGLSPDEATQKFMERYGKNYL